MGSNETLTLDELIELIQLIEESLNSEEPLIKCTSRNYIKVAARLTKPFVTFDGDTLTWSNTPNVEIIVHAIKLAELQKKPRKSLALCQYLLNLGPNNLYALNKAKEYQNKYDISCLNELTSDTPNWQKLKLALTAFAFLKSSEQSLKEHFFYLLECILIDYHTKITLLKILYKLSENRKYANFKMITKEMANNILNENINDILILKDLLKIVKDADDPFTKEQVLRILLDFEPKNIEYQIDLAKALIKQYHRTSGKSDLQKAMSDSRLNEAKEILLSLCLKESTATEKITVNKFLTVLADLQGEIEPRDYSEYAFNNIPQK